MRHDAVGPHQRHDHAGAALERRRHRLAARPRPSLTRRNSSSPIGESTLRVIVGRAIAVGHRRRRPEQPRQISGRTNRSVVSTAETG